MENVLTIVAIVLGITNIFLLTLGGFLIYLFKRIQENSKDLSGFKLEVAKEYAHKDEIENLSNRIDSMGKKLEDKLDTLSQRLFKTQLKTQEQSA